MTPNKSHNRPYQTKVISWSMRILGKRHLPIILIKERRMIVAKLPNKSKQLMNKINIIAQLQIKLAYSPKNSKANNPPTYSIITPAISSDSHSTKSKGTLPDSIKEIIQLHIAAILRFKRSTNIQYQLRSNKLTDTSRQTTKRPKEVTR